MSEMPESELEPSTADEAWHENQGTAEPSGFALIWRPLKWVLLVVLAFYVMAQLLSVMNRTLETKRVGQGAAESSDAVTKVSSGQQVRVVIEGLNLRTQPSVGAGVIIRKLSKSTTLELLARKKGWFQVRTSDGTRGWVVDRPNYTEIVQ